MIKLSQTTLRIIAEETDSWHAASAATYGHGNVVASGGRIRHWASVQCERLGETPDSPPAWEEALDDLRSWQGSCITIDSYAPATDA
jgi:hypothetical protein